FSRLQLVNGTNFTGGPGVIPIGASSQLFINEVVTIPSGVSFALSGGAGLSADGGHMATLGAVTADTVTVNMLGSGSVGAGFHSNICQANSILVNQARTQFHP